MKIVSVFLFWGGFEKCWQWLTKGGGVVGEMLTMDDEGGRGGLDPPVFGWHNLWTAPKGVHSQRAPCYRTALRVICKSGIFTFHSNFPWLLLVNQHTIGVINNSYIIIYITRGIIYLKKMLIGIWRYIYFLIVCKFNN